MGKSALVSTRKEFRNDGGDDGRRSSFLDLCVRPCEQVIPQRIRKGRTMVKGHDWCGIAIVHRLVPRDRFGGSEAESIAAVEGP